MAPRLYSALLAGAVATTVIATSEIAQAANLNFSGGSNNLDSVTGLVVDGMVFDVEFRTPNFNGAFNPNDPFYLNDQVGATAAATALVDFLNTTAFGQDSQDGFKATERKGFLIPFAVAGGNPASSLVSSILGLYTPSVGALNGDWGLGNGVAQLTRNDSGAQSNSTIPVTTSYAVFAKTGTTAVPTPALLPGLIGFGMSIIRKRKKQQESLVATA